MNAKEKITVTAAGISLAALAAAVIMLADPATQAPARTAEDQPPPLPAMAVEDSADPHRYQLRELDGYVAVYREGEPDEPLEVTGIAVASLRRADRELFTRGVFIEGAENLVKFLEDFGP